MPDRRDDFAIRHVASLARLELTSDEEVLYAKQVGHILAFATQLLEFDATAVLSMPADENEPAVLRDDRVRPSVARDAVLDCAPESTDDGLFRVPRVIG
jgi:aspartyl-tRNA(Asn)/glutamyl-tRNA(Gln) amidotransferase subunit C